MRATIRIVAIATIAALAAVTTPAGAAQVPTRVSDDQVRAILERIERGADAFRKSLDSALDRSRVDDTREEDRINAFVREFERATDRLEDRFGKRTAASADAAEVLERAAAIDGMMVRFPYSPRAQSDWAYLRQNLDQLAQAYGVVWHWDGAVSVNRVNDREVDALLGRLERASDDFRKSLDAALDDSRYDGSGLEDEINGYVREYERATDRWEERFRGNNAAEADAREVLVRAARIDAFMRANPMTVRAQEDWARVRVSLDELARAYNVVWTW